MRRLKDKLLPYLHFTTHAQDKRSSTVRTRGSRPEAVHIEVGSGHAGTYIVHTGGHLYFVCNLLAAHFI